MDTERAAEMLKWRGWASTPDWNYAGTGVLRCGSCGDLLAGKSALGEVANRRPPDIYYCPNVAAGCAQVRAPAAAVARELQTRAQKQWTKDSFVAHHRRVHLAELDAEIAEAKAVQEWCSDRRRRKQVGRLLGFPRRYWVRSGLDRLSSRLRELTAEQAALAAVLDKTRKPDATTYPSELLKALWSDWGASLTTQIVVRRKLVALAMKDDLLVIDPALHAAPYVRPQH